MDRNLLRSPRCRIYRLIEAETKKKMVASTREEYAFKPIDPAVAPERRFRPRRAVFVLTGFLLGLMASAVATVAVGRRRGADAARQ